MIRSRTWRLAALVCQSARTNAPVLSGSPVRGLLHLRQAADAASSGGQSGVALFLGAAASAAAVLALSPPAQASSLAERSFIMVKPDGVQRGLVSDIIRRFEAKGYKLVGIKVLVPTSELAGLHYKEHEGKPFYGKLVDFLSSGPVVAMVWEGKDVIKYGRTMIGATNPLASSPGTIRGDFAVDVGRNVIHGSDSVESAQKEIVLWFRSEELANYRLHAAPWIYE